MSKSGPSHAGGGSSVLPPEKEAEIQEEMDRNAVDMIMATSKLQMEAANEFRNKPNWKSYLHSQMISQEDYNFVMAYDMSKGEERKVLLEKSRNQCAKTFLNLMINVSKDLTVRHVLTMIDDMLQEDRTRVEIFFGHAKKQKQSVWSPFLAMLTRNDGFVVNQTSLIVAKLACWGPELMDGQDLMCYLTWLKDQLSLPNNDYIHTTARCLQMMLRIDEYRYAFLNVDPLATIISVLSGKATFQLQYQLIFCIWCMSFNPTIAERMNRYCVIPTLADIMSESTKEKVIRIILATFRNLIEKPEDDEIVRESALQMVQCKVLNTLELMEGKKFDDAEFQEDIDFLLGKLKGRKPICELFYLLPWAKIFELLPLVDRIRLGRVNKACRKASLLASLRTKSLDLTEDRFKDVPNNQLVGILAPCSQLIDVSLGPARIGYTLFTQLIRSNPNIEHLDWKAALINGVLADQGIRQMVACKKLRKLKISTSISSGTLVALLQGCPQLEHIVIGEIPGVCTPDQAVAVIESFSGIPSRDITMKLLSVSYLKCRFDSIWATEPVEMALENLEKREGLKIKIHWKLEEVQDLMDTLNWDEENMLLEEVDQLGAVNIISFFPSAPETHNPAENPEGQVIGAISAGSNFVADPGIPGSDPVEAEECKQ